jgi:hypothetical protein
MKLSGRKDKESLVKSDPPSSSQKKAQKTKPGDLINGCRNRISQLLLQF